MFVMACLLDPAALLRINHRLATGSGLQIPYLAHVTKSYWWDINDKLSTSLVDIIEFLITYFTVFKGLQKLITDLFELVWKQDV